MAENMLQVYQETLQEAYQPAPEMEELEPQIREGF